MKRISFILFMMMLFLASSAQTFNLNKGWKFIRDTDLVRRQPWQSVDLPHTWNLHDAVDQSADYYRGTGWYVKMLSYDERWKGKEVRLDFEGANSVTDVFVNGKLAGSHKGGYTGFSVSISSFLKSGLNELRISVSNKPRADLAPLDADFTFYGGIYRDLYLSVLSPVRLKDDQVIKQVWSADHKSVLVTIDGTYTGKADILKTTFINSSGRVSAVGVTNLINQRYQTKLELINPSLWDPTHPNLYTIETELQQGGRALDQRVETIGFRWFRFSADSGFFLNGQRLELRGISRHQDVAGYGTAVPDSLHVRDMVLIKQLGANFLRVAHYPQDPSVLRACDSLGILASVEIPVVNLITQSTAFTDNCRLMLKEMIAQNINHPSVVLWGYMNEIELRPQFKNDPVKSKAYQQDVRKLALQLDEDCHRLDPTRPTFMACHANMESYEKAGLLAFPDVIGWNLYFGWYNGKFADFGPFLDHFHKTYPGKPFFVSEYGADADARIRSTHPQRFDKSVDYAVLYHQSYYQQMLSRPFVAGGVIWNLADFSAYARGETMQHINLKGLLNFDRSPKPLLFDLYKNAWNPSDDAGYSVAVEFPNQYRYLLGASRSFKDSKGHVWSSLPAEASFNPEAKPYKLPGSGLLPYGTNQNIHHTTDDVIYQTQLVDLRKLSMPLSPGNYTVQLHFARLWGASGQGDLVYNLGSSGKDDQSENSKFEIWINGERVSGSFSPMPFEPSVISFPCKLKDKLEVELKPIKGTPVLNAIEILAN